MYNSPEAVAYSCSIKRLPEDFPKTHRKTPVSETFLIKLLIISVRFYLKKDSCTGVSL